MNDSAFYRSLQAYTEAAKVADSRFADLLNTEVECLSDLHLKVWAWCGRETESSAARVAVALLDDLNILLEKGGAPAVRPCAGMGGVSIPGDHDQGNGAGTNARVSGGFAGQGGGA